MTTKRLDAADAARVAAKAMERTGIRLPPGLGSGLAAADIGYKGKNNLEVTCWCEARTVWVSPEAVAIGHTLSCGAPGCRPRSGAVT